MRFGHVWPSSGIQKRGQVIGSVVKTAERTDISDLNTKRLRETEFTKKEGEEEKKEITKKKLRIKEERQRQREDQRKIR